MAQLTVRLTDDLAARLRQAAGARGSSVNQFVVSLLEAVTNPDLAGSQAERIQERLAAAGLLAPSAPRSGPRPTAAEVAVARRAAGRGTPMSQLVDAGRG